jgi:hypothetical protein
MIDIWNSCEEVAFGVKAVERAGGQTGGGEKGVDESGGHTPDHFLELFKSLGWEKSDRLLG